MRNRCVGRVGWLRKAWLGACLGSLVFSADATSAQTLVGGAPAPRIVNGLETNDFPTAGALLRPADLETATVSCSGVLIGCRTFLTAAHCVCPFDGATCVGFLPPNPSDYLVFLQHAGFFSVTSVSLRDDYVFPVADLAVLRLGSPVTGISPSPIGTTGPPFGTSATIVGFGRTGGSSSDYGLKRFGRVATEACPVEVSDETSVCWSFDAPLGAPGDDSNTCNGDSGGPLFVDGGGGPAVAGITSGGFATDCLPEDSSFDAKVAQYAAWIEQEGGADLSNTTCGAGPQVGGPDSLVSGFAGDLDAANPERVHSFTVAPGRSVLRVSMNALDAGVRDFDLYVKAGAPPTPSDFDCAAEEDGQYGFCEIAQPPAGTWYVAVRRVAGAGAYQATATQLGVDCSNPANDGRACDDGNPCTDSDLCQGGACAGAVLPDGSSCDDGNPCTGPDECQSGACVHDDGPLTGCRTARRSTVMLQDKGLGRHKLIWKWTGGASTDLSEFGDPMVSTGYTLCLFDGAGTSLGAGVTAPGGGPRWRPIGDKGYRYKDRARQADGVQAVVLKSSDQSRAKAIVRADGGNLPLPALGLTPPVTVQLVNDATPVCWESRFDGGDRILRNDVEQFKAKASD